MRIATSWQRADNRARMRQLCRLFTPTARVLAGAHDLGDVARVVGIRFVDLQRRCCGDVSGVDAVDQDTQGAQAVPEPNRQRSGFGSSAGSVQLVAVGVHEST